jgi:hypothetical protein
MNSSANILTSIISSSNALSSLKALAGLNDSGAIFSKNLSAFRALDQKQQNNILNNIQTRISKITELKLLNDLAFAFPSTPEDLIGEISPTLKGVLKMIGKGQASRRDLMGLNKGVGVEVSGLGLIETVDDFNERAKLSKGLASLVEIIAPGLDKYLSKSSLLTNNGTLNQSIKSAVANKLARSNSKANISDIFTDDLAGERAPNIPSGILGFNSAEPAAGSGLPQIMLQSGGAYGSLIRDVQAQALSDLR